MSCTSCCFDDARRPLQATPGNRGEVAQLLHGACADCPLAVSYLRNLPPELQAWLRSTYATGADCTTPAAGLPPELHRPRAA